MIEFPSLVIENEDELAAQAIARVSGGLTAEIVEAQIREREEILKLLGGGGLPAPICPELTNANPSAPHTVLLEAFAWLLAQQAYRLNRVPEQNLIAFANLFGIEPRPATAAETMLRFTTEGTAAVTIPAGTQISDEGGQYVFETASALTISSGTTTGTILARRIVTGHTLLAPNVLTKMIDAVAFVESVTNLSAVDSGTEVESLESTLQRVKRYQRRGERIVSTKDLEDAILYDALGGNGVVRAFPFVVNGQFGSAVNDPAVPAEFAFKPGHTTVIVMTKNGENIDSIAQAKIGALLDTAVGNQFIYIVNPLFIEFEVKVNVRLNTGSPSGGVVAAVERNLRAFYAPSREQFGRAIYRSEIIAVIEGTPGIDRIEPETAGQILIAPATDTKLKEFQLPKLTTVAINIV